MTIQGYTSRTSTYAGESIDFYLSADAPIAESVNLTIECLCDASLQTFSQPLELKDGLPHQPEPEPALLPWENGFNWEKTCSFQIPSHWKSGFYLLKYNDELVLNFVVKAQTPGSDSKILFHYASNTPQAYNTAGGKCIYESTDPNRGHRLSFDRPGGLLPDPDRLFMEWLKTSGIAVEYCTSTDLHLNSVPLSNYDLLLIVGHDEYWTKEMLDNVEAHIYNGGNMAVFSGNTCYRQIRLEQNTRQLVCYKDAFIDPLTNIDNSRVTLAWSHSPVNRPTNTVFGLGGDRGWWDAGPKGYHYTIRQPYHWAFKKPDGGYFEGELYDCVGYETDAAASIDINGIPFATGKDGTPMSLTILATADARDQGYISKPGESTIAVYTRNGTVFNVGSVNWADAMYDSPSQEALRQISWNVIQKLKHRNSWETWETIEARHDFEAVSMTHLDGKLYVVTADRQLKVRFPGGFDLSGQPCDRYWQDLGLTPNYPHRLAAIDDKLFLACKQDGQTSLSCRSFYGPDSDWQPIEQSEERPLNIRALAATVGMLYAIDEDGTFWGAAARRDRIHWYIPTMPFCLLNSFKQTQKTIEHLIGVNDSLFAVTNDNKLLRTNSEIVGEANVWLHLNQTEDAVGLAAVEGMLYLLTANQQLCRMDMLHFRKP